MNLDSIKIIPIDRAFKESERLFELYNLSITSWIELEPDTLMPSFDEYRKSMLKEKDNIWETKNFACEYEGTLIGYF